MWTEITIDNIELIQKTVNLSNSEFACFQKFKRVDTVGIIKHHLTTPYYEYRGFFYEDGIFTIYMDFRLRPEYVNWEVMRCWIKWDLLNSPDPLDALQIMGEKTVEFLKEVKTNAYMRPLNYETAPAIMKLWFNPKIEEIYKKLGIRLSNEKDGKMVNISIELM